MPTSPPVFSDGTQGSLLFGGLSGVTGSLFEWKYYCPENKRSMNNYLLSPQSIANANNPYCTVKGGWDTADGNAPHQSGYAIDYNALVILFLGILSTSHGYLGTFKVMGFGAGHSKQAGGDFDFTADQQGAITKLPVSG